jgi:membrane-bound lytic murein transglycosylase A
MKKTITLLLLGLSLSISGTQQLAAKVSPLQKTNLENLETVSLGLDEQLWGNIDRPGDREQLLEAINNSLKYLNTPQAEKAYRKYPVSGFSRYRVRLSLLRFRQLLRSSQSAADFQAAVQKEFIFYRSVGSDDKGSVQFTGYFEPIYTASRSRTEEYRYPLYRKPSNLNNWSKPHPSRSELEGADGLSSNNGSLAGLELVWLRDRLEAFFIQIQGSATLNMTDGSIMTVGYAGNTDYPYVSIGKELIKDGVFPPEDLTLPMVIEYFQNNPQQLNVYLPRNNRFIFFRETNGAPPLGSLGVPVTAERSIATDKSVMPPGALALIHTKIPYSNGIGGIEKSLVSRYVLDQDTGSAIKGPGRVDIFLGKGPSAGDRAGLVTDKGELYYLLLKF